MDVKINLIVGIELEKINLPVEVIRYHEKTGKKYTAYEDKEEFVLKGTDTTIIIINAELVHCVDHESKKEWFYGYLVDSSDYMEGDNHVLEVKEYTEAFAEMNKRCEKIDVKPKLYCYPYFSY